MARTLERMAGFAGEYRRAGGNNSYTTATLTERMYEVIDDDGVVTRTKSFDWLFRVGELEGTLPKPGDQWFVSDFNDIATPMNPDALFEAMPVGNRPCYEPHDSQGELIVVHTKQVNLDA
jgi:hypothetical protein